MHLVRTSRPEATCVTAQQVAENKRVSATAEGELITLWIRAAEDAIERRTNRSIMRQTFELRIPLARPTVTLFRPSMEGVIKVTGGDIAIGGRQSTPIVSADLQSGMQSMLPTVTFPSVRRVESGSISIKYEAGAEKPTDVPPAIQQAVLLLASHWYSNREATSLDPRARGDASEIPFGVGFLIQPYRIPNVNIAVNEVD